MFKCEFDTDGDGDCPHCVYRLGGCLEVPTNERVVKAVLDDLWGRAGFDEFWGEIQADVQQKIRDELAYKVRKVLNDPTNPAS